eukprot:TRINITY_DN5782_c0_g1_i1.p1 TRINITY_DN5782_c0_g1~~TRINITY_DN5782_c0_g1_i1.p1  ORF type:complete len:629 (+),score=139.26 TRINITY_DN5782_c0_g1_i1:169-2055(+)
MKKIGRIYGEAKIAVKERTGHKENTTEPPAIKRQTKNIEDAWVHLKDINRRMEKTAKAQRLTIEDSFLTAQSFKDYGNKLSSDGDFISLASAFTLIGNMQEKIEDLKMRFDDSLNTKVASPFQNFVKTQIKEAREEKVKYDRMRISYDAAYEKVKQMKLKGTARHEKQHEAEKELEAIETQFRAVGDEMVSTQEQVIGMHQFHSLYKLCDFIVLYRDFFQQGLEIVNAVFPAVEEYRQSADQFKEKFSQMMRAHASKQEKVKIFSMPLQDLCIKENRTIPFFLEKTIRHLLQESVLTTEGLFRVSGSQREVMEMKKSIEGGALPDFSTQVSDHNVSGLLKLYLRELPEPLVPFQMYDDVVRVCTMDIDDQPERVTEKVENIQKLFETLPAPNQAIIRLLLGLCSKITEHSNINLMNSRNLSVVLAPNILYSKEVNLTALSDANASIEFCISHFNMIYPNFEQNMFAGCGDPVREEKPVTTHARSQTISQPTSTVPPQKATSKSSFFSPQTPRLGATRQSVMVTLDPSFHDAIKNMGAPSTPTASPNLSSQQNTQPNKNISLPPTPQTSSPNLSSSQPIYSPGLSSSQSISPVEGASPLSDSGDTTSLPPESRVNVTKAFSWRNAKNFL